MADKKNEPQSYGSEKEWLTGKTGQKLDQTPDSQQPRDDAFYDSRRESEGSAPAQGGINTNAEASATPRAGAAAQVVASAPKKITQYGDKRRSYFKKRDYDS